MEFKMNPKEPAYTEKAIEGKDGKRRPAGLTKREWLVGMIASGIAANPKFSTVRAEASGCIAFANEIIKQMSEGGDE